MNNCVTCEQIGVHLVSLNNQEEQDFIKYLALTAGNKNFYWIGAEKENNEWKWSDKTKFEFTNWDEGEPNCQENSEYYVHMYQSTGKWNDTVNYLEGNNFYSTSNCGFICKFSTLHAKRYYTVIGHNLKALSLRAQLKKGSSTNSDNDSLTDWEEFDSDSKLLTWDDNGEPVFPSFTTVSKMVSGFSMSDKYVKELSGISEFLDNLRVAPFDSDPTLDDTDGDGFDDAIDPNKLKNDVTIIELRDKEYININYTGFYNWTNHNNGKMSYGGAQDWFLNFLEDNELQSALYYNEGCGLIALSDILLYLVHNEYNLDVLVPFDSTTNSYKYEEYMDYVYSMGRSNIILPKLGVIPIQFAFDFESLLNSILSDTYKVSWKTSLDSDKCYSDICKMIKNDIPVMFSFDNHFQKISNMSFIDAGLIEQLPLYKSNDLVSFEYDKSVKSHYMVITGVIQYSDEICTNVLNNDNKPYDTMLQISSFGKKYYVKLCDFTDVLSPFTNILKITRK